ncbi:hypothetical protein ZWY2020_038278 [Hordeum vulgare]|nr:hypothetical protein ZWY2020_038278 [Hordeum vulgare]
MLRTALRRGGAAMRQAVLDEGSTGSLLLLSMAERQRSRRRWHDPGRDEFFVPTPESLKWLDSVTLPMILTAAAVALFTKLLMMKHKIKNSHPEQGTVRMLSREEWDEIQEVRPRTPFESKLARPHARLRTGEKFRLVDAKDWAVDVLTDAFTRAEESAKRK